MESGPVQLYCASVKLFTEDVLLNRIAEKLKISFSDQMGRRVSPNELTAWRNSFTVVCECPLPLPVDECRRSVGNAAAAHFQTHGLPANGI